MKRKFKPEDWVKLRGSDTAPKKQVLKYVSQKNTVLGPVHTDTYVVCVWYRHGERKTAVYLQSKLIKMIEAGGFSRTVKKARKLSII